MKRGYFSLAASCALLAISVIAQDEEVADAEPESTLQEYNGNIKYFIADLGPTSPCHPLYERSYTFVDTTDNDALDNVLTGLFEAGFNGIRLPMWPDDEAVKGPDPTNEAR